VASLEFVCFKGISIFSKLVKFFTRGEYSHVAVLLSKGDLIEVWKQRGGVYWDFSTLQSHTKGTPYEVYSLPVEDDVANNALAFYRYLALRRVPYNYLGVIGFVIPVFTSNGGYFCSEGCWEGLAFASSNFRDIEGWRVSPTTFVQLIKLRGAELVYAGEV